MATINNTFVSAISEPGLYGDDKLTGFRLKVTPAGSKIYLVYGKVKGHPKPVKVTIGRHGAPWTPQSARSEAERIIRDMRMGENPNEVRRLKQQEIQEQKSIELSMKKSDGITLGKVFDDYLKTQNNMKESTKKVYTYVVNDKLADWLSMPIKDISEEMVETRYQQISAVYPGTANNVMRILRALFRYAVRYKDYKGTPIVRDNPVNILKGQWKKLERRQSVIKSHQLKDWYIAVSELQNTIARDYLLVLLLTGLRKNECAKLLWKNVDFKDKTFLIQETKNSEDLILPMSDFLYSIFLSRWKERTNEFVFPGQHGKNHIRDLRYLLLEISKKSGVQFTLHDLRRTFATIAYQLCTQYQVKRMMNHKDSADVTSGYIIADVEQLREPIQKITDTILGHAKVKKLSVDNDTISDIKEVKSKTSLSKKRRVK